MSNVILSYLKEVSEKISYLYTSTKRSVKEYIKKFCSEEFINLKDNNTKKDNTYLQVYEYCKNKVEQYEKDLDNYEKEKINNDDSDIDEEDYEIADDSQIEELGDFQKVKFVEI